MHNKLSNLTAFLFQTSCISRRFFSFICWRVQQCNNESMRYKLYRNYLYCPKPWHRSDQTHYYIPPKPKTLYHWSIKFNNFFYNYLQYLFILYNLFAYINKNQFWLTPRLLPIPHFPRNSLVSVLSTFDPAKYKSGLRHSDNRIMIVAIHWNTILVINIFRTFELGVTVSHKMNPDKAIT